MFLFRKIKLAQVTTIPVLLRDTDIRVHVYERCLPLIVIRCETISLVLCSQCGADVNRPDSYDQTALDIVNKFTTSRAAKELKQLLKGESTKIQTSAV